MKKLLMERCYISPSAQRNNSEKEEHGRKVIKNCYCFLTLQNSRTAKNMTVNLRMQPSRDELEKGMTVKV